jgi:DNA primase
MTRDSILNFLYRTDVTIFAETSDFIRCTCPFREHTHHKGWLSSGKGCFSISKDTGFGSCWVCGERGNFHEVFTFYAILHGKKSLYEDLLKDLLTVEEGTQDIENACKAGEAKFTVKVEALAAELAPMEIWFSGLCMQPPGMTYLSKRQVPEEAVEIFDLKYDPVQRRLLFPMYGFDSPKLFLGVQGRSILDEEPKVRHYDGSLASRTFVYDKTFQMAKIHRVLLVEGPFDLLRIYFFLKEEGLLGEFFPLAISGNKVKEHQLPLLSAFSRPVFLMLDNDPAGRKGEEFAMRDLRKGVPFVFSLDYSTKDPGEISKGELLKSLEMFT